MAKGQRFAGIGFDMAFVEKLFSPLRQLNPPYAFEGAGLGLATVRHIVARMGGGVWAEGEPERGATFWFTLQ
ncbi:MAG: ATP-binding protein [Pseudomonadota bacterium]|nr:ATP-binding protein [Pseudomonadota bacterium]